MKILVLIGLVYLSYRALTPRSDSNLDIKINPKSLDEEEFIDYEEVD